MGLGKTKQAIDMALTKIASDKKILVLCPKRLAEEWKKEIFKHSDYEACISTGNIQNRLSALLGSKRFVIINPNILHHLENHYDKFLKLYGALLIDEMTTFRRRSRQTKSLLKLAPHFHNSKSFICGLSAAIVTEKFQDVFNPCLIIYGPGPFGKDYEKFLNRYFTKEYGKKMVLDEETDEYKEVSFSKTPQVTDFGRKEIKKRFRKIASVIGEDSLESPLPEKVYFKHIVTLTQDQKAMMDELRQEWKINFPTEDGGTEVQEMKYDMELFSKAQQITSGFVYKQDKTTYWFKFNPKIMALNGIVDEIGNHKFLVWCAFQADQKICVQNLTKNKKLKVCHPDDIDNFEGSDYDCAVLTYAKNCYGHNLPSAMVAIRFSRPIYGVQYIQAEGRNRRGDSKFHSVVYHDIHMDCPIENRIQFLMKNKMDLVKYMKEATHEEIFQSI